MVLGATIATLTAVLPYRYTASIQHEGVTTRYIDTNACRRAPVVFVSLGASAATPPFGLWPHQWGSGAVGAKRSRACCPSVPSSPSATAKTLALTTITFCPNVVDSSPKGHPATAACGDAVENLILSGLVRIGDQTTSKIFL